MIRRASTVGLFAALVLLARPARAADTESIYGVLGALEEHSILFVAAGKADEAAGLKGAGPLTLFAPTDAAFKKLDDAEVQRIATDPDAVKKLFNAHLATGRLTEADLTNLADVRTLGGTALKVESGKDGLRVGGAKVVASIPCSNGVIHVIDAVLPVARK